MKNDLHLHTNLSACASRENTWESLLVKCEEAKLDRISVTDHNTCLFHIINMFNDTTPIFSGEIIPGMECCSITTGATIDLLAYNFDVLKAFDWSFQTYGTLETRQTKMKDMLLDIAKQNNFKINTDMIFNGKVDYAHKYVYHNLVQFPENAWLFEKYNICNFSDFYRASSINKNFPFYLQLENIWPSVKQVTEAIHSMGGVVILAHPYNYKENISGETLLQVALDNGLDGIEVYHPSANQQQIDFMLNFAKEHNMIVTGGSDFHGIPSKNKVGIENIDSNQTNINI